MNANDPQSSRRREEADDVKRPLAGERPPHVGGYKSLIAALVVLPAAIVAFLFLSPKTDDDKPIAAPGEDRTLKVVEGATVNITTDPGLVFTRAFWRRPGAEDTVLQSERLEWMNESSGVVMWQWFLQVEPSAGLLAALRDPANFGLTPVAAPRFPGDSASAPPWFPSNSTLADFEILQGPSGGLVIFYRKDQNMLFATDAGGGFAPAAVSLNPTTPSPSL